MNNDNPTTPRRFQVPKRKARPTFGGYYRWREMMDLLKLWPEDKAEEWHERNLEK